MSRTSGAADDVFIARCLLPFSARWIAGRTTTWRDARGADGVRRGRPGSIRHLTSRYDARYRRVSRRDVRRGRVIRRAPCPGFRAQGWVPVWERIGVEGGPQREGPRPTRATDPSVSSAPFDPRRYDVPPGAIPARGRGTIAIRHAARPAAPPVITPIFRPGEISPSTCHGAEIQK